MNLLSYKNFLLLEGILIFLTLLSTFSLYGLKLEFLLTAVILFFVSGFLIFKESFTQKYTLLVFFSANILLSFLPYFFNKDFSRTEFYLLILIPFFSLILLSLTKLDEKV
jgi:hypothetical protein